MVELRRAQFGQSIVLQQIPLDAFDQDAYDPRRSVSRSIQGRINALLVECRDFELSL